MASECEKGRRSERTTERVRVRVKVPKEERIHARAREVGLFAMCLRTLLHVCRRFVSVTVEQVSK